MLYIMTNPRVLSRLLAEISQGTFSSPIRDSEAKKLPYLQAVIKEGLRIHPPVVGLQSKEVPAGGDTLNGMYVPQGTKIGYCAWGIFRDKKIWGEDADVFRPERWLEGSPEKIEEEEHTLELIFGHGKYKCLGRPVALIELNKIFVEVSTIGTSLEVYGMLNKPRQLLRRFDFTLVDPAQPWKSIANGVFTQSDMWVTLSRRGAV
jgi:cytochrome P450